VWGSFLSIYFVEIASQNVIQLVDHTIDVLNELFCPVFR
jgi:hypothetical protein